ncbi:hypothetical protein SI65_06819 [Aspergillus cristatus]|uniref:Uncharacterized protein n=1 Tax=Aspergillus cristatus TaxID=573508 RepID=A0A1E3BB76_ASPCR|nr:hypothetical protein SI65_06819 [Aspergillus cristatus]
MLALNLSGLVSSDHHRFPHLGFAAGQLRALHGRHRVQAGAEVLPPADRWWTVDLYLDEEYANQKKLTDGEIYRKIRQYEGMKLSESGGSSGCHPAIRTAWISWTTIETVISSERFDRLLPIPGLWPHGMRISMLHRLIATGCVEEILTYLDHIGDFWSSLAASDSVSMEKIDLDIVNALQLLAPGKSGTDTKRPVG